MVSFTHTEYVSIIRLYPSPHRWGIEEEYRAMQALLRFFSHPDPHPKYISGMFSLLFLVSE